VRDSERIFFATIACSFSDDKCTRGVELIRRDTVMSLCENLMKVRVLVAKSGVQGSQLVHIGALCTYLMGWRQTFRYLQKALTCPSLCLWLLD